MSADLERARTLRRQMMAETAHELRTPITVIAGYLEAMANGDLAPSAERIASMHAEARRLGRLVEDLRVLSLADARELRLDLRETDVVELLESTRAAFAQQALAKAVELTVVAPPDLPRLPLDPDRIGQVLANLVTNALRHTPAGGRVKLEARRAGGEVEVSVVDSGSGIPADSLPHVFERYYRADPARGRGEESGLGLAIARALVEAHGGTITVESRVGGGTTFTLRLPAQASVANR
jgi:signal transduction histidine kinase